MDNRNFSGLSFRQARKNTSNALASPEVIILYKIEYLHIEIGIGLTALYAASVLCFRVNRCLHVVYLRSQQIVKCFVF